MPILLLVSRLVKEKDLEDLVSVHRILLSRDVRFTLAIVGDGPMRGELRHALPDAVFAGHRVGADLARWYASADVFVFPSTTETLGNVVLGSGVGLANLRTRLQILHGDGAGLLMKRAGGDGVEVVVTLPLRDA